MILNIDGTYNKAGSITWKCQLEVQFGNILNNVDFYITDLGQDWAILGFPLFQKFNPMIDWKEGTITQGTKVWIKPIQIWEHRYRVWHLDHKLRARADVTGQVVVYCVSVTRRFAHVLGISEMGYLKRFS